MRWQIAQFFELQWWRGYLKKKSPEEYLQWKKDYWLRFMAALHLKVREVEEPVIDIGCGPAGVFTVLEDKNIVALDPLLQEYEGLAIFDKARYPKVNFVNKSFESYQNTKQFKTVFCLNAINHFIDIKSSFQKLYDITSPGGEVIVSIDAHNHAFFRWLFALLPLDVLHPHQYYLYEYEEMLVKTGYELVDKVEVRRQFFFNYYVLVARKS